MHDNVTDSPDRVGDDIVWGVPGIAIEIGKTLSETQYMVRKGMLPVTKLGPKTIIASRRQLRRRLTPHSS